MSLCLLIAQILSELCLVIVAELEGEIAECHEKAIEIL